MPNHDTPSAETDDDVFVPPDEGELWWSELFQSGRRLVHDPLFLHMERIPRDTNRLLFVGNHSLFALDAPPMWLKVHRETGLVLRPLGDKFLFQFPMVKRYLNRMGGVEGTRENCAALMQSEQPILVYPGGSREAMHRRGDAHKLDWGERAGFAQMAIRFGYTLVPFACVGIDDQWDYLLDGDHLAESTLGRYLKKTGLIDRDELFPPLIKGVGPTPIPKPNRHYYAFGEPISTTSVDADDPTEVWVVRESARIAVQGLIDELLAYRENDPRRDFRVRITERALNLVDKLRGTFESALDDLESGNPSGQKRAG